MRAKCYRCGFLTKFPWYMKEKFKRCYRCGGSFKIFYTNKKEEFLDKSKQKEETKKKDERWKEISKQLDQ